MQRTLLELGYFPAAYIPAMTFHRVERLDAVRMVRLLSPLSLEEVQLHGASNPVADLVTKQFREHTIAPRLAAALPGTPLFRDLNAEQTQQLAAICNLATFERGEALTQAGCSDGNAYLLLSGTVEVRIDDPESPPVGTAGPGETIGECSLLQQTAHAAGATATEPTEAAVISAAPLEGLLRRRPDIGLILYRNFATQLGEKLLRTSLKTRDGKH